MRIQIAASCGSTRHQLLASPQPIKAKGCQSLPSRLRPSLGNSSHGSNRPATIANWRGVGKSPFSCQASEEGKSEGAEDEDAPEVMGDWRAFRAKLVSESLDAQKTSREATDNFKVLSQQNPALAAEGLWCHPATVEAGGIIVAQPSAPDTLRDDRYWQVVMFLIQHDSRGTIGLILNRPSGITLGALPVPEDGPGGLQTTFPDNALYLGGFNANQTVSAPWNFNSKKLHPWRWKGTKSLEQQQCRNGDGDANDRAVPATKTKVFKDSRLHCGGYAHQQVVHLIHGRKELSGSTQVVPGIYMGGETAALDAVNTDKADASDFRFFAGCKVWEPGQLAAEIEAGAWVSASCSRSLVLKQCLGLPTPLWKEVMELMGGEFGAVARVQYGEDI